MSHINDLLETRSVAHGSAAKVRLDVACLRLLLLGIATLGVVFAYGLPRLGDMTLPGGRVIENGWVYVTRAGQIMLLGIYIYDIWIGSRRGRRAMEDEKPDKIDLTFHVAAALSMIAGLLGYELGWHIFEGIIVCLMLAALWQLNVVLSRRLRNPGLLLPLSFLGLIALGTPLLKLPLAIQPGAPALSWMDALFTATSAVCVTGLVVRDTASQFTPFGQTVICVLVQLGGLGMIIFGSMLAVLLGSRPSLRENMSLSQMLDNQPLKSVTQFVRFIVLVTLGLELIGALVSFPMWEGDLTFRQRLGMSLFHAVNAYCNAGFALYPNSLENYRYSPIPHLVVGPLIVMGGLGFPVLNNLWSIASSRIRRMRRKPARFKGEHDEPLTLGRLNLHTKIVLTTSAILYLYGTVTILASLLMPYVSDAAGQNITANRVAPPALTLDRLGGMVADASFLSITARTAGYNAMPMEAIGPGGHVALMTLMVAGGAPGGTTGGIKVTTLALIILSVWATVRQRDETQAFGRRIYDSFVRKATALAAALALMISISTMLLTLTEPFPFIKILFEVVSAASTTGLSLGITADLSTFGKAVILVTMFLGRVGPLALLGALVFHGHRGRPYRLPHEDVMIG